MTVRRVHDLATAAYKAFLDEVEQAILARGRAFVALSGGSTPKAVYERLQPSDLDWSKVELFFSDERDVPLEDERSNFRMVKQALLNRVEVATHPLTNAAAYDQLLRDRLPDGAFDVLLLGMGDDGHTASLFPGSPALLETERWVVEGPGVAPSPRRFTITPPVLAKARRVLIFVGGAGKADVLKEVLEGPPGQHPAQLALQGEWLVDEAAASRLTAD
ncbi:MAG: 6-phosphogluconolactonase [Cyanobacteria bacterium RYN_339]|nr:6-phosphogluconolactonase [Cyanobacteria bacterium RYN_339]